MNQSEFAKHIGTTRQTVSKMKKEGVLAMNGKLVDVEKSMEYLKRLGRVGKANGKILNKGTLPTPRHHASKTYGNLKAHYDYNHEKNIDDLSNRIRTEFRSYFKQLEDNSIFLHHMESIKEILYESMDNPKKMTLAHMGLTPNYEHIFILSEEGRSGKSFTHLMNRAIELLYYQTMNCDIDEDIGYSSDEEINRLEKAYRTDSLNTSSVNVEEKENLFEVTFTFTKTPTSSPNKAQPNP